MSITTEDKPDFESWSVEKLSKYIYGSAFTATCFGDPEGFRKSLIDSAHRAWDFDQAQLADEKSTPSPEESSTQEALFWNAGQMIGRHGSTHEQEE